MSSKRVGRRGEAEGDVDGRWERNSIADKSSFQVVEAGYDPGGRLLYIIGFRNEP
jgi:hypothetical protein